MLKNIRTVYFYLVSLITLGMIIIGTICIVNNIASYFYPDIPYYSYYDEKENVDYDYNKEVESRILSEKRESVRNSISSGAVVVVALPLYIYHNKKANKEAVMEEIK